jgi:hypothetical protein
MYEALKNMCDLYDRIKNENTPGAPIAFAARAALHKAEGGANA